MKRNIKRIVSLVVACILLTLPLCGYAYGTMTDQDYYYTRYALVDNTSGVTCANVIVPYGWTAYLSVDWTFPSISTPGVCRIDMYNQDGTAEIHIRSAECFMQADSGGFDYGEGVDPGTYQIYRYYANAAGTQERLLSDNGYNATLISEERTTQEEQQILNEAAYLYLQSCGMDPSSSICEGTMAKRTYQNSDGSILEFQNVVIGAQTSFIAGSWSQTNLIMWKELGNNYLKVSNASEYDEYKKIFDNVVNNSYFTSDFYWVSAYYGMQINQWVQEGLQAQAMSNILADSYLDSPNRQDTAEVDFTEKWSDVITERNDYTLEDGSRIKVDTKYDTVYQNGDEIYMGPDAYAPDNWTKLDRTY